MRPKKTWLFEGEQRTSAEIMALVPAIKAWETLRRLIEMGMTTRREVLSYDTTDARRAGGKRGYAKTNGNNYLFAEKQ